jgi:hypothetical protein
VALTEAAKARTAAKDFMVEVSLRHEEEDEYVKCVRGGGS